MYSAKFFLLVVLGVFGSNNSVKAGVIPFASTQYCDELAKKAGDLTALKKVLSNYQAYREKARATASELDQKRGSYDCNNQTNAVTAGNELNRLGSQVKSLHSEGISLKGPLEEVGYHLAGLGEKKCSALLVKNIPSSIESGLQQMTSNVKAGLCQK